MLPCQAMSYHRSFEGLEEGHRFEICLQGSVGQQHPGESVHERGLEEVDGLGTHVEGRMVRAY